MMNIMETAYNLDELQIKVDSVLSVTIKMLEEVFESLFTEQLIQTALRRGIVNSTTISVLAKQFQTFKDFINFYSFQLLSFEVLLQRCEYNEKLNLDTVNAFLTAIENTHDAITTVNLHLRDQESIQNYSIQILAPLNKILIDLKHTMLVYSIEQPIFWLTPKDNQLQDIVVKAAKEIAIQKNQISSLLKNAEDTVKSITEAAAKTGVTQHAKAFQEYSDDYISQSITWLICSIVTFGIAVGVAIALSWPLLSDPHFKVDTNWLIARLTTTSGLFLAFFWCSRQYSRTRHNHIINKHKALCLQTFQTFVNATDNASIRDEVLKTACHAIFTAEPSGYVKEDGDGGNWPNMIMQQVSK